PAELLARLKGPAARRTRAAEAAPTLRAEAAVKAVAVTARRAAERAANLHELLGLGRPNLPGFSPTGPRSVNDWSADLVGHAGTGHAEIPCSNWRTPSTEPNRRSHVNSSRCSPPHGELALVPTTTARVAATPISK